MAGSANVTINHDDIKRWVEERGGCPARVKTTGSGDDPGIIRIDYTGFSGQDTLEKISWDEWFAAFEDNELAFLHQDQKGGRTSRFSKLISRAHANLDESAAESQPSEREPAPAKAATRAGRTQGEPVDAINLLKEQHALVRALFGRARDDEAAFEELIDNLALHVEIEELVLYPMLPMVGMGEQMYRSVEEHLAAKRLIADLIEGALDDETRLAKIELLEREVLEHVDEEEREVFPQLERALDEDQLLGLTQELVAQMVALLDEGENAPIESVLSQTEPM